MQKITFLVLALFLSFSPVDASVSYDNPKQQAAYEQITIALTYIKYGQLDEALQAVKESIRLYPSFDGYYNEGLIYMDKKDYSKSAASFEKAHEMNPEDLGLNYNYGVVLLELGKFREAKPKFERLLKDNPKDQHLKDLLKKAGEGVK